jgi:hypothetical protein
LPQGDPPGIDLRRFTAQHARPVGLAGSSNQPGENLVEQRAQQPSGSGGRFVGRALARLPEQSVSNLADSDIHRHGSPRIHALEDHGGWSMEDTEAITMPLDAPA